MTRIIIVESPTKANTLSAYTTDKIIASKGHIAQLPPKANSIDIDNNFKMKWQFKNVQHLEVTQNYSEVIIATDNDREGEGIAWHIANFVKKQNSNIFISRAVFNSIDKKTFLDALQNLRSIDYNQVNSYFARLSLDYLFGFTMSPFLWRKLPGNKSAGRVQSAALQILCEREKELQSFKPETFFKISATDQNNNIYILQNFKVHDKAEAEEMVTKAINSNWKILKNQNTQRTENPSPPFNTATLQQKASQILNSNAKYTMSNAQKLYEGVKLINKETTGVITYMRTDSLYMSIDQILKTQIQSRFGDNFFTETYYGKKTAHCAIYPTNFNIKSEDLIINKDIQNLYKLIYNRAIESQMSSAKFNFQEVILNSEIGELYACKNIYIFDGFYKNRNTNLNRQYIQPELPLKFEIIEEQTHPPFEYQDGSLIKKLSKLVIGRPSTYDKIISILIERKYIIREKKALRVTLNGLCVNELLSNCFCEYINSSFTSEMENQLNLIATGHLDYIQMLKEFWVKFNNKIINTNILSNEVFNLLNTNLSKILITCNNCQIKCCIKYSKHGCFFACTECNKIQSVPLPKSQKSFKKYRKAK